MNAETVNSRMFAYEDLSIMGDWGLYVEGWRGAIRAPYQCVKGVMGDCVQWPYPGLIELGIAQEDSPPKKYPYRGRAEDTLYRLCREIEERIRCRMILNNHYFSKKFIGTKELLNLIQPLDLLVFSEGKKNHHLGIAHYSLRHQRLMFAHMAKSFIESDFHDSTYMKRLYRVYRPYHPDFTI